MSNSLRLTGVMLCFTDNRLFFPPPQVVQSGGKNIELAVIRRNQPLKVIALSYDVQPYLLNAKVVTRIVLCVFAIIFLFLLNSYSSIHLSTLLISFSVLWGRSWSPKKSRPWWQRLRRRRKRRPRRRSRRNPLKAVNLTRHFLLVALEAGRRIPVGIVSQGGLKGLVCLVVKSQTLTWDLSPPKDSCLFNSGINWSVWTDGAWCMDTEVCRSEVRIHPSSIRGFLFDRLCLFLLSCAVMMTLLENRPIFSMVADQSSIKAHLFVKLFPSLLFFPEPVY